MAVEQALEGFASLFLFAFKHEDGVYWQCALDL